MGDKTIVFVNQYFHPLNNPPAKRLKAFAEYFSENNWNVKVITGMPNYPDGKLLKGYKFRLFKRENYKKVDVYRFFEIPFKIKGFLKPFLNYLSFTLSSLFSFNIIRKADIVFISSPPIFSSVSTFFIAKLFKKKIVFDVRDLYPESAEALGFISKKSFSYKLFEKINYKIFEGSDLTLVNASPLKDKIADKYNVKDIGVVPNFSDKKSFSSSKKKSNKIKIAFTGVTTEAQDLSSVLKLATKFKSNIEFHIVGSGSEFDLLEKIAKNNKNIKLYGYRSKSFCSKIINKCDIGLITLADKDIFRFVLPSKFFEYISFGKPVIANQSLELKNIIKKYDCGWFVNDKNLIEVLSSISQKDIRIKSKNAKKLFDKKYEKEKVCKDLFEMLT